MEFNFKDYSSMLNNGTLVYPKTFLPYYIIDRKKYSNLEQEYKKDGIKLPNLFNQIKIRMGRKYFDKIYSSQCTALNFSESCFPAYRFLLPDVIVDDWLGIVDIHKKFCRDHALHQPLTSYIVFKLLGGGNSDKALKIRDHNMLDYCVERVLKSPETEYLRSYAENVLHCTYLSNHEDNPVLREVIKSIFFQTAMMAAVFHDIGYPWQYIMRLNNSLKSSDFNVNDPFPNVKHFEHSFKSRLIMYPFYGYKSPANDCPCMWHGKLEQLLSDSLSKTHGFPGALAFLYLNDIVRKYPSQDVSCWQMCVDWAALGIMMHDMGGIYRGERKSGTPENEFLRLSFDKDPLSCIVTLADVIEEFERPSVSFINIDKDRNLEKDHDVELRYDASCISTELSFKEDVMYITYLYKDDDERIKNMQFKHQENEEYFDPRYGYVDLSSIGINKVEMICKKM